MTRQQTIAAWTVITLLALTVLLTLVNEVILLVKNIGVMK